MDNKGISTIAFPFKGEWRAVSNPGDPRLAYDFCAVGGTKNRIFSKSLMEVLFGKATVDDSYTWSKSVFAPCNGKVVRVGDGWPDRRKLDPVRDFWSILKMGLFEKASANNLRSYVGNYIVMSLEEEKYLFMAHLKCNSPAVKPNQQLRSGEFIGEAGNSGNSLIPHVHIQVMNKPNPLKADLLPFRFRRCERMHDNEWRYVEYYTPKTGERLRAAT